MSHSLIRRDYFVRQPGATFAMCLVLLLAAAAQAAVLQQNEQGGSIADGSLTTVVVSTETLEKSLEFYREILGFRLDRAGVLTDEPHRGALQMELSGFGQKIDLLLPDDSKRELTPSTGQQLILETQDVVSICDTLKGKGHKIRHDSYKSDSYSFFTGPNRESIVLTSFPVNTQSNDWKELLDEDLSQWEVHTGVPHKSVVIPGRSQSNSENGIDGGEPVGLADPLKIYTVQLVDGEPVLKVTGEVFAGLTTLQEFDSYHLSLQFRWGEKKWEPRLDKLRDSGLLFHCVGPHGVGWNAWMQSLECQIQEGDCGDFIPVDQARAFVPLGYDGAESLGPYEVGVYDPTKPPGEVRGKVAVHRPSLEFPNGQWNTIEIYTVGTTAVFVVNGIPNMAIFDAQQTVDGELQPLSRGKIQVQSEAAELEYRRMKIRPIKAFPDAFADLVNKSE